MRLIELPCVRLRVFGLTCMVALLWAVSQAAAAPPQVTFLYPAGGQIGQSVNVTSGGTFSNWPVQVWSSRSELSVECQKDKGKLLVKISPDASPGVAWLRLYDAEGAAALRPFLIGTLPEAVEQEPNDQPHEPQSLSGSTVLNGQLGRAGDVDVFALDLAKGQTLVAAMDANRELGSPMDAALQILNAQGFVLAQNDDERGIDPMLVFSAPAAGKYFVRTFAFPATPNSSVAFAGGDTFIYRLTLTTEAYLDAALPLALAAEQTTPVKLLGWNLPEDQASKLLVPVGPQPYVLSAPHWANTLTLPVTSCRLVVANQDVTSIELPAVLTGQLVQPRQKHEFAFTARKGDRLVFRSESRSLGYAIDPLLTIADKDGKQLAQNDDAARDNREVELSWTAPAEATYRLIVRDLHHQGGPRYVYRLTAGAQQPDFTLKLAAEAVTVAAGKSVEIAVSVDRQAGFKEEIECQVINLPEGVTASSVQSAAKGDSAKGVKLKLTAAADAKFQGPIRIVGRAAGEAPLVRTAVHALAGLGATTEDVWLTVTSSK